MLNIGHFNSSSCFCQLLWFFFFFGGGGVEKNSWNPSGNNMCSKRCCLEEVENTILQNHIKREVKLAKTLALLTGISLFTWLPFQILNILVKLKVTENFHLLQLTIFIIKILQ